MSASVVNYSSNTESSSNGDFLNTERSSIGDFLNTDEFDVGTESAEL